MQIDYYEYLRRVTEYYGRFPSISEYTAWAKENEAPTYPQMYLKIGSFSEAAKVIGAELKPRGKYKKRMGLMESLPMSIENFQRVGHAYISDEGIVNEYELTWDSVNTLIRKGLFPPPAFKVVEREFAGTYWSRREVRDFFKNYNTSPTKEVKYLMRRKDVLDRVREIFREENIKSPKEYLQKSTRSKGYVDARTLWVHSITFEEIIEKEKVAVELTRDLLPEGSTTKSCRI